MHIRLLCPQVAGQSYTECGRKAILGGFAATFCGQTLTAGGHGTLLRCNRSVRRVGVGGWGVTVDVCVDSDGGYDGNGGDNDVGCFMFNNDKENE